MTYNVRKAFQDSYHAVKTPYLWQLHTFVQASAEISKASHSRCRKSDYLDFSDRYLLPAGGDLQNDFNFIRYSNDIHNQKLQVPDQLYADWYEQSIFSPLYDEVFSKTEEALLGGDLTEEKHAQLLGKARGMDDAKNEILRHEHLKIIAHQYPEYYDRKTGFIPPAFLLEYTQQKPKQALTYRQIRRALIPRCREGFGT